LEIFSLYQPKGNKLSKVTAKFSLVLSSKLLISVVRKCSPLVAKSMSCTIKQNLGKINGTLRAVAKQGSWITHQESNMKYSKSYQAVRVLEVLAKKSAAKHKRWAPKISVRTLADCLGGSSAQLPTTSSTFLSSHFKSQPKQLKLLYWKYWGQFSIIAPHWELIWWPRKMSIGVRNFSSHPVCIGHKVLDSKFRSALTAYNLRCYEVWAEMSTAGSFITYSSGVIQSYCWVWWIQMPKLEYHCSIRSPIRKETRRKSSSTASDGMGSWLCNIPNISLGNPKWNSINLTLEPTDLLIPSSGQFKNGTNSNLQYQPQVLSRLANPVVIVQINYLLEVFGFLASSDLATEYESTSSKVPVCQVILPTSA
jgi:hypothetical protein